LIARGRAGRLGLGALGASSRRRCSLRCADLASSLLASSLCLGASALALLDLPQGWWARGERAEAFNGRMVVRTGSLRLTVEMAQRDWFAPADESGLAPAAVRQATDAFAPGGLTSLPVFAMRILAGRPDVLIGSAVCRPMPVDMVHDHRLGGLHDLALHESPLALLSASRVAEPRGSRDTVPLNGPPFRTGRGYYEGEG
jgi:hypothetical protein